MEAALMHPLYRVEVYITVRYLRLNAQNGIWELVLKRHIFMIVIFQLCIFRIN